MASGPCPVLSRALARGMRGHDVLDLQAFFVTQGLLTGDVVTGFFGDLTQGAVQRWQAAHGIVSAGTPSATGYGEVGPKTRRALANCAKIANQTTTLAELSIPAASVIVGAIRWDAWRADEPHGEVLDDPALTNRIPYFAIRGPDKKLVFPGNLEHVLSADIHYAKAAGIDYFIFGYYLDTGSWGRDKAKAQALNRAFRAYLNLPSRAGVKFALSMNWSFPPEDVGAVSEALIDAVAHPDYVQADDGTVPVFFFAPNIPTWIKGLGGDEAAAAALAEIKRRVWVATGREIYAIALMFDLKADGQRATDVGFDALSTYAIGSGPNKGEAVPYANCMRFAYDFWARGRALPAGFVPNVSMGWDYRPTLKRPNDFGGGRDPNTSWCEPATDEEWIEQIRRAQQEATANPHNSGFSSIIFYAWNEFSEGGWIAPTVGDGTRRLEVVARALGRSGGGDRVELKWPARLAPRTCDVRTSPRRFAEAGPDCQHNSDALTMDWPCPPGLRAIEDRLRTPSGTEALLWTGPWQARICASD